MRRILRISAPQFLDSLIMWTGNFLVASIVGYIGRTTEPGALGAHVIVIRIEAISYLPGWALAVAAATLTGQYLGLGDARRARQATGYCLLLAALTMGSMGVCSWRRPTRSFVLSPANHNYWRWRPDSCASVDPPRFFSEPQWYSTKLCAEPAIQEWRR